MFQAGKSILNQMTDFIEIPVHVPILILPVVFVKDIRLTAAFLNLYVQFVRIVLLSAFTSRPRFLLNLQPLSTRGGADAIHIARCNDDFQWIVVSINYQVNLAGRPLPTDTNGVAIFAATCRSIRCILMSPDITAVHHE